MENIDYDRLEDMIKARGLSKSHLCRALNRPNYYLRDAKKCRKALGDIEIEILARELNVNSKYLRGLTDQSEVINTVKSQSSEIQDLYDSLNSQGQTMLFEYGRYLCQKPELKNPEKQPSRRYIRHYLCSAAAGYAAPIEGEDFELVEMDDSTPPGADFSISISGDSMEPYIHDGQSVYVQRDKSLEDMDVGIFFVDGEVFCKQYCRDYTGTVYLLSANPKREDANITISASSGRNLVCFGRVMLPKKLPMPIYY